MKSAEEFFAEHNGGKGSVESTNHGETITPTWAVKLMHEYAAQQKSEWVPVSERLPEVNTQVLVITTSNEVLVSEFDEKGKWWRTYTQLAGVTHWQPLPQLPNQ